MQQVYKMILWIGSGTFSMQRATNDHSNTYIEEIMQAAQHFPCTMPVFTPRLKGNPCIRVVRHHQWTRLSNRSIAVKLGRIPIWRGVYLEFYKHKKYDDYTHVINILALSVQ